MSSSSIVAPGCARFQSPTSTRKGNRRQFWRSKCAAHRSMRVARSSCSFSTWEGLGLEDFGELFIGEHIPSHLRKLPDFLFCGNLGHVLELLLALSHRFAESAGLAALHVHGFLLRAVGHVTQGGVEYELLRRELVLVGIFTVFKTGLRCGALGELLYLGNSDGMDALFGLGALAVLNLVQQELHGVFVVHALCGYAHSRALGGAWRYVLADDVRLNYDVPVLVARSECIVGAAKIGRFLRAPERTMYK